MITHNIHSLTYIASAGLQLLIKITGVCSYTRCIGFDILLCIHAGAVVIAHMRLSYAVLQVNHHLDSMARLACCYAKYHVGGIDKLLFMRGLRCP